MHRKIAALSGALVLLLALVSRADAQSVWSAVNGVNTDTNWSDATNWQPNGVPGANTNVLFNDTGDVPDAVTINNVVDTSLSILSLSYKQDNGFHNTFIPQGVTLTISNSAVGTNILVGTETDLGATQIESNTISGPGTFAITSTNTGAVVVIRQASTTTGTHRAGLDMSGLNTFNATLGRVLIATQGSIIRPAGTWLLAKTNNITASGTAPALDIGDGLSNGGNALLQLGQTNNFNSDSLTVANQKSTATLNFNPAFSTNATLVLRGRTGPRVSTFNIGDNSAATSVGSATTGNVDLTGGRVDAMVDAMIVAKGQNGTGAGTSTATFTMATGNFDVNTLDIGVQNSATLAAAVKGTANIIGGTMTVNTRLRLGTYVGTLAVPLTSGTLNVSNATLNVNVGIVSGGGTSALSLSNATLNVKGAIGTVAAPIGTVSLVNASTISLPVASGSASMVASNLNIAFGNTTILVSSVPSIPSYPAMFTLVQYVNFAGDSTLALGPLPGTFAGYITNDTPTTYTLVITSGPTPSKTISWNGNLNGNWDTSTLNWRNGGSAASYNQGDFVNFDDSLTGTPNVVLTTALSPGGITLNNLTNKYVFSGGGKISGNISLNLNGTGPVVLDNSGSNDFLGSVLIGGGSLQIGNGDTNGNLPSGATVTANGTLIINRTDSATVGNVISGNGALIQNGSGTTTLSGGNSYAGGLTLSNGTLRLNNASAAGSGLISINPNTVFIAGGAATNSFLLNGGTFGASVNNTYSGDVTVSNGTVNTVITADPQNLGVILGTDIIFTGNFHGTGSINLLTGINTPNPDAGNGFRLRGTVPTDFSGIITLGNSVKGEVQASTGGPFSPAGNGLFVLTCGPYAADNTTNGTYSELNVRNNSTGDTTFGNNIVLTGTGLAVMNPLGTAGAGTLVNMGSLTISNGQELGIHLNSGSAHIVTFTSVTLKGGTALFAPRIPGLGSLTAVGSDLQVGDIGETKAGSGINMVGLRTMALTGNNTYTGNTTVSSGTLTLIGTSDLTNSPNILVATNAILDANPRGDQTLTLIAGQTLTGSGTVNGNLTIGAGATFAPNATTGIFTVTSGAATLAGTTTMTLDRSGLTQSNSTLNVANSLLTVGGALNVVNAGPALQLGDSFQLFTPSGGFGGTFATTNLPAINPNLAWDTSTLLTDGTIRVAASGVIHPVLTSAAISGTNIVIHGTSGSPGAGYIVLASPDITRPLSSWTHLATNTFSDANFSFTNGIAPGAPIQFYLIELQ